MIVLVVVAAAGAGALLVTQGDDDDDGGSSLDAASSDAPTGDEPAPGELSAEEQAYVDALSETAEGGEMTLSTDQTRCLAVAIVDVVGLDVLQAGATADEIRANPEASLNTDFGIELDRAGTDALGAVFNECFDFRQVLLDGFAARGAQQEVLDCVEENLRSEVAATFTAAEIVGSQDVRDALGTEFEDALAPCAALGA